MVSIPVGDAFECVGMDIIELECSKDGNRYALVFQDYLSKWPEVYAVTDRKAETVAKCLLKLCGSMVSQRGSFTIELLNSTPHSSTGVLSLYLTYGLDPVLPTSLDFCAPTVKYTQ